jgi:hypothetical protein
MPSNSGILLNVHPLDDKKFFLKIRGKQDFLLPSPGFGC